MLKTYYEVQYSTDGKSWLTSIKRYDTQEEAVKEAQNMANQDVETRVVEAERMLLNTFPKVPGKEPAPIPIGSLGFVS